MSRQPEYVWMGGDYIRWQDAKVHVASECAMRGANVFEGIRGYLDAPGTRLMFFRLPDHLDRFFNSMKLMRMQPPYARATYVEAIAGCTAQNGFAEDVYVRLTTYFGLGKNYGYLPDEVEIDSAVIVSPRGRPEGLPQGIHCMTSTWLRISDRAMPPRIKAGANYQNSRLAFVEARINGYDGALLLNADGRVAEGPGACLFIVRAGTLITPPVTAGILESITRATVLELATRELGIPTAIRDVDRTEVYLADEAFFCGTAQEITPIISLDRYAVGSGEPGAITRSVQQFFFQIVRGERPAYSHWLTPVPAKVAV